MEHFLSSMFSVFLSESHVRTSPEEKQRKYWEVSREKNSPLFPGMIYRGYETAYPTVAPGTYHNHTKYMRPLCHPPDQEQQCHVPQGNKTPTSV